MSGIKHPPVGVFKTPRQAEPVTERGLCDGFLELPSDADKLADILGGGRSESHIVVGGSGREAT